MPKKKNTVQTVITIILVLLVLLAVAGIAVAVIKNKQPFASTLGVSIDGREIAAGSEAGTIESGSVITVSGATGCNVAVYAYCPEGVDFEIIVDGETYYWSEFTDLNVTDGFIFNAVENGFEIQFDNFNGIISKSQGGAVIKVPDTIFGNIFRMVISAEENTFEFIFGIPLISSDIILSQEHIIF